MQRSRPTLVFKFLILLPPTLYLPHRLRFLAVFLCFLLPLSSHTFSGLFNGMLEVSEPGALHYYTLSGLILLILFVFRNLSSIHLPLFGYLDSLICDLIAPTPGLACFLPMTRTLAEAWQDFSFSELSTSSLDLTPTLIT